MDDEFELLGRQDPEDGPRRPWALLTGIAVVALVALAGVGWMVSAMLDGGTRVRPAAVGPATTAAPTTTPAPTRSEDMTIPTVPSPTPSVPVPSITVPPIPVRSATAVLPPPTPVRTTVRPRPVPVPIPVPVPTVSRAPTPRPVPGRLVRVPDVVGQRVKGAVATLQAAGFRVTVLGGAFAPPEDRDARRVTAQRPGGGGLALRGSFVVLITNGL
ncbi:MAG: hypothetical protein AVDCRST_MAG41-4128 [uncultured Corynebacteriales bacterium]|uniref:PASTA domain-containing protein n=1 Tax=uncultured Mycobacteriales bacterium TaxID=581187 RepID=A0A6J4JV01_9ACTN|nr:MAG: hypothetical protein AVDCRST_MAG41-4128 [uncultured Corynebacteriales bacterium]